MYIIKAQGVEMKKILFVLGLSIVFFSSWYLFKHGKKTNSNDVIIVGTNAEYPPFSFVKNDTIVGFDIDIISEICKRLGKKIIIKDMPFDVLIPEIQRGSINLIAAGMTPTEERAKEVIFTQCYFVGDPLVIISPSNKSLTKIDQLFGKEVIVNEGYTADFYMTSFKEIKLKRLQTPAAAFLALDAGRADAYVVARSTVSSFFKQYGNEKFIVTSIPNTEEKYAIAVSPCNSDLLPKLNNILDDMKKDGTLDQLKQKWGLN
ncbi:TPA: basic amino acid ABC transporter substrate-binding protein [Candidatus Dependentiae bacterium]|nr:MAG: Extracellular solute-binding protein family 3 [candidate division TM6 bacterium GW2011_GWE2_31_21]KKP54091.1 MAG: Extracellular solute-binding protein family 3 [candidate division TM6 bacterium GW2011_GWF2_33_332]HBS48327.1 basic amino acid ABC transporter substrate-binding protein [Candidatus Dependentiae bacterium]HBZ72999.1 basic amino acid ABC transporter substrate-binding protein [Candidatus Dependentiae bacterium]